MGCLQMCRMPGSELFIHAFACSQGTKRSAQSEDDLDSAHSLKRLCSNTLSTQPPHLVIDVSQSIHTGISPRLVGVEELGLLSLRNAAGAAGADLGMWSVLPEVGAGKQS